MYQSESLLCQGLKCDVGFVTCRATSIMFTAVTYAMIKFRHTVMVSFSIALNIFKYVQIIFCWKMSVVVCFVLSPPGFGGKAQRCCQECRKSQSDVMPATRFFAFPSASCVPDSDVPCVDVGIHLLFHFVFQLKQKIKPPSLCLVTLTLSMFSRWYVRQ